MVKLFDYVKIIDRNHPSYGFKGQLTDYDTIEKRFILHFDKISKRGFVYWVSESTRVRRDQVVKITKLDLPRFEEGAIKGVNLTGAYIDEVTNPGK